MLEARQCLFQQAPDQGCGEALTLQWASLLIVLLTQCSEAVWAATLIQTFVSGSVA